MYRWPIIVSYLSGCSALWLVWLGDQIWRTPEPRGAVVCWLAAFMLVLACMAFAQQDGVAVTSPKKATVPDQTLATNMRKTLAVLCDVVEGWQKKCKELESALAAERAKQSTERCEGK